MRTRHPRRNRSTWTSRVAALAAILLLAACVSGAAPAEAGAAAKPVPVGVVAVRSLDAVAALVGQLGLPLPQHLTAKGIEAQFPFLGEGALAGDAGHHARCRRREGSSGSAGGPGQDLGEPGRPPGGQEVLMTASAKDFRYIDRLVALKPEGPTTSSPSAPTAARAGGTISGMGGTEVKHRV
jgi:hypothetical protein